MSDEDVDVLARFQSALVGLLAEGLSPADTRARLARDPEFEPFRELVATIDERSLGVASRIVKKYARRRT